MASAGERLCSIRRLMAQKNISAYLVPSTDEHQSEYVPEHARRIEWVSGFSGSAATLLVTHSEAFLWTDGRYHLQASQELDPSLFTLMRAGVEGVEELEELLCKKLSAGQKVGLDPRLVSIQDFKRMEERLEPFGILLYPLEENLVDLIWDGRPCPPNGPIFHLDKGFAGMDAGEKLSLVRQELEKKGVDAMVTGALDEIAWLLNLRGSDVPYNPVFQSYMVITREEALLFVDSTRLDPQARVMISPWVQIHCYEHLGSFLQELTSKTTRLLIDPARTSHWVKQLLGEGIPIREYRSPVALLKAVKNSVEREGMASCHRRDAVALVRFLRWLEMEVPKGGLTETKVASYLDQLRASLEHYAGPSFETIVAYGPHGAVVHFRPSSETDLELGPEGILLVDSGAHYLDGTTDVTRTVALGRPTALQKELFTRVLKGHIMLAGLNFPKGTTGKQLDALARTYLWHSGLDYRHGTGHGIGCYLNVHEGPQAISPKDTGVALEEGMFVTNEPGYYQEGEFGIRLENVMMVERAEELDSEYGPFLRFKTITMVPFDRKLINLKMLTARERDWVNRYHKQIMLSLGPELEPEEAAWLERATRPL